MDIVTVGNENFVLGFEIAGIKNSFVIDRNNANETFEKILGDSSIGIAVTDKSAFAMLNERIREKIMTSVKPTFVILSFDIEAEENLRMMIKRSLGVDLW